MFDRIKKKHGSEDQESPPVPAPFDDSETLTGGMSAASRRATSPESSRPHPETEPSSNLDSADAFIARFNTQVKLARSRGISSLEAMLLMCAQVNKNRGQAVKSAELYRAARILNPDNALPYRGLAQLSYDSPTEIDQELIRDWLREPSIPKAMLTYFEGVLTYRRGNMERALELLREAVFQNSSNYYALNNIGRALLLMGYCQKALLIFRHCLKKFRKQGDLKGVALVQGNIGLSLVRMGELRKAVRLYRHLLRVTKEDYFAPERCNIFYGMGELCVEAQKLNHASNWFQKGLEESRSCRMLQNQIACLYWLASISQLQNQKNVSESSLQEGLSLSRKVGDTFWTAELLRCQANLHILRSQFVSAEQSLGEALDLYRQVGSLRGMASLKRTRAKLLDQSNRSQESANDLHWAAKCLQSRESSREFYEALVALCFLLIESYEIGKALALMIEFINTSEQTRLELICQNYQLLAKHDFEPASALDRITDFVSAALNQLGTKFSDSVLSTGPKAKNELKVKYQFVAYFLSDYRYKLVGVQLHGSWDRDLTGFDDFMTPHCGLSLSEIISKLSRNILTRRNTLMVLEEEDRHSNAAGKEVSDRDLI